VSATGFHGDATRLYNVLGVQNSGTLIGVAKTINFSSNLNATFGSGITTVTASIVGVNTLGTSNFNQLVISGLSTFRGSNNTNVHLGNTSYYAGLTWSGVSGIYTGTEPSILTDSSLGLEISGGLGDLTLSAPSGTGDVILKASNTTAIVVDNSDSAQVELYQGGTKKFETIGAGVTVFGTTFSNDLNASGIVTATGGFVSSANTSLEEVEKKQSLEAEKTKIEDSESETKEDPKKSIESYGWKSLKDGEDKQVYYKKEDWDDAKSADKQKEQIAIGKIVKGSVDDTKKELKIYNEASKKTFTKSISDVIDKAEGDKNSSVKIKEGEEEKKEENKEYKEIKEGDKDPEAVKLVKKKLNSILPKAESLEDTGDYDKKLKESLVTTVRLMKSIGILDSNYKEDTSKITLDFQKKLDEYIKEVEQIRKDLPK
jgi:hypothetical protein